MLRVCLVLSRHCEKRRECKGRMRQFDYRQVIHNQTGKTITKFGITQITYNVWTLWLWCTFIFLKGYRKKPNTNWLRKILFLFSFHVLSLAGLIHPHGFQNYPPIHVNNPKMSISSFNLLSSWPKNLITSLKFSLEHIVFQYEYVINSISTNLLLVIPS